MSANGSWQTLRYIVVDELGGGIASLVVSPWPRVDDRGRLNFGSEDQTRQVTTSTEAFEELLHERRFTITQVEAEDYDVMDLRPLAVGDVFAAFADDDGGGNGGGGRGPGPGPGEGHDAPLNPQTWVRGRLIDVTAYAREAAKIQASATSAGAADEELLNIIGEEHGEEDGPMTPDSTPTPPSGNRGGSGVEPGDDVQTARAVSGATPEANDDVKKLADSLFSAGGGSARAESREDEDEDEGMRVPEPA